MPALTPRNVAIGAAAVTAATFMFPRSAKKVAPVDNMYETPGVKNVASRYAAQGGTENHLPGAATPLGNSDRQAPNTEKPTGMGSGQFENSHADQKISTPMTETSAQAQKAWSGNEKGK